MNEEGVERKGDEIVDRRAGRTTISLSAMAELQTMAKRLNAHLVRHGAVVVTRDGSKRTDELAEWAFNLLDTYRSSPGGKRVQWVSAHFPGLHAAMVDWAGKPGESAALAASRRFEVQAALAFGFMLRFSRAPKQGAISKDEAKLAKWLTRKRPSLGRSEGGLQALDVFRSLQETCRELRKSGQAEGVAISCSHPLFTMIAKLWLMKQEGHNEESARIKLCVSKQSPFWTWPAWMAQVQTAEDLRRHSTTRRTT